MYSPRFVLQQQNKHKTNIAAIPKPRIIPPMNESASKCLCLCERCLGLTVGLTVDPVCDVLVGYVVVKCSVDAWLLVSVLLFVDDDLIVVGFVEDIEVLDAVVRDGFVDCFCEVLENVVRVGFVDCFSVVVSLCFVVCMVVSLVSLVVISLVPVVGLLTSVVIVLCSVVRLACSVVIFVRSVVLLGSVVTSVALVVSTEDTVFIVLKVDAASVPFVLGLVSAVVGPVVISPESVVVSLFSVSVAVC